MNENGNKRREWIKTAAIIFLAVMLVLTFFSNTIMNYSLPEVATQYVMSGSITAKIRGTGTVESGDPYNIEISESRKVTSVAVRVGDTVEKGDVLLYLDEMESDELKMAQDELENAKDALQDSWDAYYARLLTEDIQAQDIQAANGNTSPVTYRQQITNAQKAIEPLKDRIAELTNSIAGIDAQLALVSDLDSSADSRVTATESAMETARTRLSNANQALTNAENALNAAMKEQQSVSNGDFTQQAAAAEKVAQAQKNYENAQAEKNSAQNSYNDAVTAYNNAVSAQAARAGSQATADLMAQRAYYQVELSKVTTDLEAAQKNLDELLTLINHKLDLDIFQKAIDNAQENVEKAQKQVDELTEKAIDATVTADISGTVTAVNVVAGNTTTPASPLVVLQPEGQGYTLSFSVTNEQSRRLSVGDRADLVNAWRYDDVNVVLASIKPDPDNPGQNKLLTFNVDGAVIAGQTLSLSVGQQSANFDLIVPNSAIREDNNGKFILIVESRPTPISTRYIATRVDVEVLASDDTQSAISGALYGYEYVITTSTQPVDAGQQVRLTNN